MLNYNNYLVMLEDPLNNKGSEFLRSIDQMTYVSFTGSSDRLCTLYSSRY